MDRRERIYIKIAWWFRDHQELAILTSSRSISFFKTASPQLHPRIHSSMAIKKCILLCLFLASSIFITSDALPAKHSLIHRLQKRSGLRLCGRMLVEALAALCQSEYYAPSHIKRNYAYNPDNFPIWDNNYPEEMLDSENVDFFSMNQLSRRGIADECCIKSCNIVQLSSYCGRPLKMK